MFLDIKKNKSGFTLAEMVVAMAVFITALTSVSSIFLFANRSQRKTQAVQESQSDARFALEIMAQQIRRGSIDYGYYGGAIGSNPKSVLAILDQSGNSVMFRRHVLAGIGVLQISQDSGSTWHTITPAGISVNMANFYISPNTNPFVELPVSDQQILVTIALHTTNLSQEGSTMLPMFLQTTISSRQYLR
jgi:type II secretory pathway pseudopilin PulG